MKTPTALLLTILITGVVSRIDTSSDNIEASTTYVPLRIKSHVNNLDADSSADSKKPLLKVNSTSEKESYSIGISNGQTKDETFSSENKRVKLKKDDLKLLKPFLGPKDVLMQEIRTLNEEASNSKVICKFLCIIDNENQFYRHIIHTYTQYILHMYYNRISDIRINR